MWATRWIKAKRAAKVEKPAAPNSRRDRLAAILALMTVVCLGAVFMLSKGTVFLMPGPLTSAHGAVEECSACHTKSGSGKLSWVHGLVAGDPLADSKACLSCHKMPDTAFNAHGATVEVLRQSTDRLAKVALKTPAPQSARAQSVAFPMQGITARGVYCATCHQEHQGASFDLKRISNEQCRSCHVVQFDSFDGNHPPFDGYPFRRRTRIVYDHAGHFGKHFPEVAKKHPERRIPDTCSTCHNSREDRRVMAVAPFEQTCNGCHLNQILGEERVSGPKGIAFLALPGLDLPTLEKRKAAIGEWPDASEADLTPFMKVMISKDARGQALIKAVESLNLQDLSGASDDQIKAVTDLVWQIKGLVYALIKGKASDVLGNFNFGGGAKLSAELVTDLTASIPRDVVVSAQQQWLPNLATEMANRPVERDKDAGGWNTVTTNSGTNSAPPRKDPAGSRAPKAGKKGQPQAKDRLEHAPEKSDARPNVRKDAANTLPPPMRVGAMYAEVSDNAADAPRIKGRRQLAGNESGGAIKGRWDLPSGTPRSIDALNKDGAGAAGDDNAGDNSSNTKTKPDGGNQERSAGERPGAAEPASSKSDEATNGSDIDQKNSTTEQQPQAEATEQTDDLLFPTQDELSAMKAGPSAPQKQAGPAATATPKPAEVPADAAADKAEAQTEAAPVIRIESDVDPESWAEYGGWYRQDYAIYYRPTGHKDKFIYAWLYLTGAQARTGDASPAAAVFDSLTGKDAQGSCTKCHSVDDLPGKGRVVNFSPRSVESDQGRFTNFVHEPHFAIRETRGCLACHELEKGRPYLKSYEQGDPKIFASGFGSVKKDVCQGCHTSGSARQDCMLCHKYHVNEVITPILSTKIPTR